MNTLLSSCQAQPFKGTRLKDPLRGSIIDSKERGQVGQTSRHFKRGDKHPDLGQKFGHFNRGDKHPDMGHKSGHLLIKNSFY